MEDVVEVNGGGEAEIENDRHHLPHHLHQSNTIVVSYPLGNYYHRLPSGFLIQTALLEVRMHQNHHPLPMVQGQWPRRRRLRLCLHIRLCVL